MIAAVVVGHLGYYDRSVSYWKKRRAWIAKDWRSFAKVMVVVIRLIAVEKKSHWTYSETSLVLKEEVDSDHHDEILESDHGLDHDRNSKNWKKH